MKRDGDEQKKLGGWGVGEYDGFGLERFMEESKDRNRLKDRGKENNFEFSKCESNIVAKNGETEDDREQIAARNI